MTDFDAYFEAMRDKTVAVVGFGVSNRPLIPFLLEHGARVTVFDKKTMGELGPEALNAARDGVTFVSGEKYLERAEGDVIFRSPGIHPKHFAGRSEKLTSEAEAFFEVAPCPIIGITGSDGKSTTTTLISKILEQAGYRTHLGGNIGKPLLPVVPEMRKEDVAVMELSSFQLMTMKTSPHVAVVTNVTPNHLDIHKDMEEYIEAKKNIFLHQKPGDRLVVNLDNGITAGFEASPGAEKAGFSLEGKSIGNESVHLDPDGVIRTDSEEILDAGRILLPGRHNIANYMAAIAATRRYAGKEAVAPVAETFGGVVHRLELVREKDGIRYINSSIDSSPTRTIAALSVFGEKIVAIMGGYDKHLDYAPLAGPVKEHCAALVLMGATASKIDAAVGGGVKKVFASDMADAVAKASALAQETGSRVVLLSPASASFDMFRNFEERGNIFRDLAEKL